MEIGLGIDELIASGDTWKARSVIIKSWKKIFVGGIKEDVAKIDYIIDYAREACDMALMVKTAYFGINYMESVKGKISAMAYANKSATYMLRLFETDVLRKYFLKDNEWCLALKDCAFALHKKDRQELYFFYGLRELAKQDHKQFLECARMYRILSGGHLGDEWQDRMVRDAEHYKVTSYDYDTSCYVELYAKYHRYVQLVKAGDEKLSGEMQMLFCRAFRSGFHPITAYAEFYQIPCEEKSSKYTKLYVKGYQKACADKIKDKIDTKMITTICRRISMMAQCSVPGSDEKLVNAYSTYMEQLADATRSFDANSKEIYRDEELTDQRNSFEANNLLQGALKAAKNNHYDRKVFSKAMSLMWTNYAEKIPENIKECTSCLHSSYAATGVAKRVLQPPMTEAQKKVRYIKSIYEQGVEDLNSARLFLGSHNYALAENACKCAIDCFNRAGSPEAMKMAMVCEELVKQCRNH